MVQGTLRRPARNLVPIEVLMVAPTRCESVAPAAAPVATTAEIGPIGWRG